MAIGIIATVAVVASATTISALTLLPGLDPSSGSSNVRPWWSSGFSGCCFDDGIRNAATFVPPIVHTNTSTLYVVGSVNVASWTRFNGTANVTASCSNTPTPPGACDVFVGVWTPAAWAIYAAGGPLAPAWCYSANGSVCANASSMSFTTTSLVSLEGESWEVVVWNIEPYGLMGNISLQAYVSSDFYS